MCAPVLLAAGCGDSPPVQGSLQRKHGTRDERPRVARQGLKVCLLTLQKRSVLMPPFSRSVLFALRLLLFLVVIYRLHENAQQFNRNCFRKFTTGILQVKDKRRH